MANLREYPWRDGSRITYQVRWRDSHGIETSRSFEDSAKAVAVAFMGLLESLGEDAAEEWLDRRAAADTSPADTPTLNSWMAQYIAHLTGVTPGTRDKYGRDYNRTYAQAASADGGPPLGGMPIDMITRNNIAWATNELGTRLSRKSVQNAKGLLAAAFKAAVEDPHVNVIHNPCRGIKLGTAGEADEDERKTYLTPAEFEVLYAAVPGPWRPLVLFLVGTGMRISEATALQIRHIDLRHDPDRGVHPKARIARAWKRVPGGWEIGPPKTKKSRRTVTLPPAVVDAITPLIEGRPADQFLFTPRTDPTRPLRHQNFYTRVWAPAVRRAGRCTNHQTNPDPCGCAGTLTARPRIHDLRHTHVAWLVAANIPLPTIQERLGHESIQTTIDVYGSLLPDMQVHAAYAVSETLAPLAIGPGPRALPSTEDVA